MMLINSVMAINEVATHNRRKRDPEATREAILKAAITVLAHDGPDGVSVSQVANLAGVNRGTAYQHFRDQKDLINETVKRVSVQLSDAVFGGSETSGQLIPIYDIIQRLVEFAIEHPELGRIWLFEVLASSHPADDVFFKRFERATAGLAASDFSQGDIDSEALSVLMLAGYFLWPVWAHAHGRGKTDRQRMANRMSKEALRLSMYGVLRPEYYPRLRELLQNSAEEADATSYAHFD